MLDWNTKLPMEHQTKFPEHFKWPAGVQKRTGQADVAALNVEREIKATIGRFKEFAIGEDVLILRGDYTGRYAIVRDVQCRGLELIFLLAPYANDEIHTLDVKTPFEYRLVDIQFSITRHMEVPVRAEGEERFLERLVA